MDRRFLTVLGMSVVLALVVAGIFYQITSGGAQKAPTDLRDMVVAAEPLPLGANIKPNQVKVIKVPVEMFPKTGFQKVEEVLDRPVISGILADEPIVEPRLAPKGSGMGLAPKIPSGYRAVAVRVNDVVGVAGFVLPGMRVDVLVTGRPTSGNTQQFTTTTTLLQNVEVLSANQQVQPDARGQAIPANVVNLLVTPQDAELITLAQREGQIQLVLRNSVDTKIETPPGKESSELFSLRKRPAAPQGPRRVATVKKAEPPPPPPPAPVVVPDEIIVIRGNTKSVETVGVKRQNP